MRPSPSRAPASSSSTPRPRNASTELRRRGGPAGPLVIRHLEYTRARLRQTAERLTAMVYRETVAADEILVAGPVDRITWEEAQALPFREARLGEPLGPLWSTWWFRIEATVPQAWKGGRVDLL